MRLLVELEPSLRVAEAARAGTGPAGAAAAAVDGLGDLIEVDPDYDPVVVPAADPAEPDGDPYDLAQPLEFSFEPDRATRLIRGTVPDGEVDGRFAELIARPGVAGAFADPEIDSFAVCPKRPIGTHRDVARALGVKQLESRGMTGRGVLLAVVDSGINLDHLRSRGQKPKLDVRRSWVPRSWDGRPGQQPPGHGTMCAFGAGIAAPDATLLDYGLLLSSRGAGKEKWWAGALSDAVKAYEKLLGIIRRTPKSRRRMVVTNSWGMFSERGDFPKRHPGNYSSNRAHPFNRIVASLEREGADIVFAAGNCGRPCPSYKCGFNSKERTICGANSHPRVLTVAGIDHRGRRIGYSAQGPGRLDFRKPDIVAPTEFDGSRIATKTQSDDGTSTSCPVAAGVLAAVRTKYSAARVSPWKLRALVCRTAEDLGRTGYDHDHGWGAIDPPRLVEALAQVPRGG